MIITSLPDYQTPLWNDIAYSFVWMYTEDFCLHILVTKFCWFNLDCSVVQSNCSTNADCIYSYSTYLLLISFLCITVYTSCWCVTVFCHFSMKYRSVEGVILLFEMYFTRFQWFKPFFAYNFFSICSTTWDFWQCILLKILHWMM